MCLHLGRKDVLVWLQGYSEDSFQMKKHRFPGFHRQHLPSQTPLPLRKSSQQRDHLVKGAGLRSIGKLTTAKCYYFFHLHGLCSLATLKRGIDSLYSCQLAAIIFSNLKLLLIRRRSLKNALGKLFGFLLQHFTSSTLAQSRLVLAGTFEITQAIKKLLVSHLIVRLHSSAYYASPAHMLVPVAAAFAALVLILPLIAISLIT